MWNRPISEDVANRLPATIRLHYDYVDPSQYCLSTCAQSLHQPFFPRNAWQTTLEHAEKILIPDSYDVAWAIQSLYPLGSRFPPHFPGQGHWSPAPSPWNRVYRARQAGGLFFTSASHLLSRMLLTHSYALSFRRISGHRFRTTGSHNRHSRNSLYPYHFNPP
jgi:hypothetical protein